MQLDAHGQHQEQGGQDRVEQAGAYEQAGTGTHRDEDQDDDDGQRLEEIGDEGVVGLQGHLVLGIDIGQLDAYRQLRHDLCHFLAYARPGDDRVAPLAGGKTDAYGRQTVETHQL